MSVEIRRTLKSRNKSRSSRCTRRQLGTPNFSSPERERLHADFFSYLDSGVTRVCAHSPASSFSETCLSLGEYLPSKGMQQSRIRFIFFLALCSPNARWPKNDSMTRAFPLKRYFDCSIIIQSNISALVLQLERLVLKNLVKKGW